MERIQSLSRERGQSLVEFALSLPILLLILLGTIDVSRVFYDAIRIREAVVQGVTYGQHHPFDSAGISSTITGHGIPSGVTISTSADAACASPGQNGNVSATASKVFTPMYISTLRALGFGGTWSFTVSSSATMRCLT